MYGQTDVTGTDVVGDRERAGREVREHRLVVEGRAVHLAAQPDAEARPKLPFDLRAVDVRIQQGDVLVVVALAHGGHDERADAFDIRQARIVERGDSLPGRDELVQTAKVDDPGRSVELAHAP